MVKKTRKWLKNVYDNFFDSDNQDEGFEYETYLTYHRWEDKQFIKQL